MKNINPQMRRVRRVVASVLVIWLLGLIFIVIGIFLPFVPSLGAEILFRVVVPSMTFLALSWSVLNIARKRSLHSDNGEGDRSVPKVILSIALLSFGWGWGAALIPCLPTMLFAKEKISFPVTIVKLDGLRLEHDYWTWIYYKTKKGSDKFMWTRSDPLMQNLAPGDCIMLHARKWPMGMYVDSISFSVACDT